MKELLKNIINYEREIEQLRAEYPNYYPYYSGYLKGLRDIKWILLKQLGVIK